MAQLHQNLNNGLSIRTCNTFRLLFLTNVQHNWDWGEVGNAVLEALSIGYKHIDCAAVYGNEKEVGEALSRAFSRNIVRRSDVWITSKLWNTCHSAKHVRQACLNTLRDLCVDYLDLYLTHWPFAWEFTGYDLKDDMPVDEEGRVKFDRTPMQETWKEMEKLVDEGLVRSIGLSNTGVTSIIDVLSYARIPPAVVQVEVNPTFSREGLVDFCKTKNIHVTGYSPFGSTGCSMFTLEGVKSLAQKYNKSPAQIIIRWEMQRELSVIPKSVTSDRIKENLNVFDFSLAPQDMELMNSLNTNITALKGLKYAWGFDPVA